MLAIICVIASALCGILRVAGMPYIFSAFTSFFAACCALFCKPNGVNILLALGLMCSVVADWFLAHQTGHSERFIYGIIGFFIAHCLFTLRCMTRFKFSTFSLVIALVLIVLYSLYMLFRVIDHVPENTKVPVILYTLISITSLYFAMSADVPILPRVFCILGTALILFSDTMIAENTFCGNHSVEKLILPTYYACHVCLALSAVFRF